MEQGTKLSATKQLGNLAETYAARYLAGKGYVILSQNYRQPWGEIDIVARKEDVLMFVEVKANRRELAGFEPELRVDHAKRQRMARIAQTFLQDMNFSSDQAWQMDVVSVTFIKERGVAKMRHYKNI